ncbi:hypothetical protein B0T10DRAFT_572278 [Thelonectria olida]|uniref:SGNH hydrolase-type esterase domain-containing protein n=1 Tax=Thelonectria olida TaxID=1576542 RepID=A0A9P9AHQ2_9HYPO|nr:hypothetical protein B0T10DRAFT_572278 [Thelonectria olida]
MNDDITVDMIGTLQDGDMPNNNHEGQSGKHVTNINEYWKLSIKARPNVVLLHAGTNNIDENVDLDIALDITRRKKILPVPIHITVGGLADAKHPNDKGYGMANAWLKAILEADSRGLLKGPVRVTCKEAPRMGIGNSADGNSEIGTSHGKIWDKKGTVFQGFRTWEAVSSIRLPVDNSSRDKVILADLNGNGIADCIVADKDGTVRACINGGKPNDWTSIGKISSDWSSITGDMIRLADVNTFESLDSKWATGLASRDKAHFGDIDGDGCVDYVIVCSGGTVKWARNTHNSGNDSKKKNWETAVTITPGLAGMPFDAARLRDINGDGKAGKCCTRVWQDGITISPGVGEPGSKVKFADLDGDGCDDFLILYDGGAVKCWLNLKNIRLRARSGCWATYWSTKIKNDFFE